MEILFFVFTRQGGAIIRQIRVCYVKLRIKKNGGKEILPIVFCTVAVTVVYYLVAAMLLDFFGMGADEVSSFFESIWGVCCIS